MKNEPRSRFFVPDLSPQARHDLNLISPQMIFIAESPHTHEVQPEELQQRRPLCGMAGRHWWGLLSQLFNDPIDLELKTILSFCATHRLALINAVSYPLDPKIVKKFPDAHPLKTVGFTKISGVSFYKTLKDTQAVQSALKKLHQRLKPFSSDIPIVCLGNDAFWFIENTPIPLTHSIYKIPHPSAWWRKKDYRLQAHQILKSLLLR